MIKYIYSIYDGCADAYSDPMLFTTDAAAKRALYAEALNPDSFVAKFPVDFTLVCIGEFEVETGSIKPMNVKTIARATDFVKKEKNND